MKVGISTACFYPFINTEDTLDIIKSLGFDICEVFLESSYEYSEGFCHELRYKADKLGIEIYSVHAFNAAFEPFLFDRYERRRWEMEKKYVEVCKAGSILGAKYYTFHGIPSVIPGGNMELIASGMDRLVEISNNYGIGLSQENVSWCKSGDPEYIKKLNECVDIKKGLYYTLDIKQAIRSNRSPLEYLELYGDNLSTVHINDATMESSCLLPGKGNIDLKEIIDRVRGVSSEVPFIIEVYRENFLDYKQLIEARDYLYGLER